MNAVKAVSVFVFLIFTISLCGQESIILGTARNHFQVNAEKWGLKSGDFSHLVINSTATTEKGITYSYINQTYDGIPVRNAIISLVTDKNGKVLSDAHSFVQDIESKIAGKKSSITASDAILRAADILHVSVKGKPVASDRNSEGKQIYDFAELSKSPISVQQSYVMSEGKLVLAWSVKVDMLKSPDYWDLLVDANSGLEIGRNNLTVYCQHHPGQFKNHSNCTSEHNDTHAGTEVIGAETFGSAAASYRVFKLPVESPNHGGRSLVTDAQFPAASPFGWHDTNGMQGAEYTITRGNNAYAYEDKDDDDSSDGDNTDGGAGLVFDFPIDMTKDPRETFKASVTNLFYAVNMMHDITHVMGFDENFGNFQQKNYTNKGDGSDYVLAQAFDGITLHEAGQDIVNGNPTKINNANFSTPSDGFNGRMQMFFWDNEGGAVSIDSPDQIKGFVAEYGQAQFGLPIPNETEPAISGNVAILRDNSTNPTTGCGTVTNGSEISGKVALIDRGLCDFSKKVYNAQQSGAVAVIICNIVGVNGGNGEEIINMSGGQNAGQVTIPSIFMKKSDCDKIRLVLAGGTNVTMTFKARERVGAEYLDGSLDNGVIAHEFAHGISNRLTGGRLADACLTNDEQMGEGWSDFFALVVTHEPGDKGTDSRGIGTFASGEQITGGGIRRYPYSTDMNINPQTFDDIKGTTSPHQLGEVWTDMLWDMYWAFIDAYGYDPDWTNINSGNHKAVFLVMEGMKMQPCNPGFIAGRNAIFKADEIHYNSENKCLLWNVFARRGLGYFAEGGNSNDRSDGVENFDALPTCIEKLKISKTVTPSINPGDEVTVELRAINHIPARQNSVVVTDQLPDGMSFVSGSASMTPVVSANQLKFELGDMDYDREIVITYKARSSASNKSVRKEYESFDGEFNWDIEKIEGNEDWLPTSDLYRSPDISFNIINVAAETDASLRSIPYQVAGNNPVMRFWHKYNTETGNDGGFVEISANGGPYIPVLKDKFIRNPYNGPLAYSTLAIPALDAFSGNSGGNWTGNLTGSWKDSYIDMSQYKGKTVVVRFRFGSNATTAAPGDLNGWFIDDFELLDIYKYVSEACIAADNGSGEAVCTDEKVTFVNTENTVATGDQDRDYFTAGVAPNPATDHIVVWAKSPVRSNATLEIMTADGRVVLASPFALDNEIRVQTINLNSIPAGFYIVRLVDGQKVTSRKLIVR